MLLNLITDLSIPKALIMGHENSATSAFYTYRIFSFPFSKPSPQAFLYGVCFQYTVNCFEGIRLTIHWTVTLELRGNRHHANLISVFGIITRVLSSQRRQAGRSYWFGPR